jgi:hypothetical protein
MGVGLVVGWCAVWYAAAGTFRGWVAVGVLALVAAAATGAVEQAWTAGLRCLGAIGVSATVHLGLRRLLSARVRGVSA